MRELQNEQTGLAARVVEEWTPPQGPPGGGGLLHLLLSWLLEDGRTRGAGMVRGGADAWLDIPTIGVTHRTFGGQGEWPADERGAASPVTHDGEIVGFWLHSRVHARPVVVHAAWRTPPEVAIEVARRCIHRARTPEPLRRGWRTPAPKLLST